MPDADAGRAEGGNDVDHLTSAILRRWRRRLRRRADDRPRSGDRGESERLLVASLIRASSSNDDTILPGLAAAAARYGAGQQRDRPDPGGLCDELSCLRQLVWTELKSQEPSVHAAVDRILRFDRALSIVVKAAVTAGYSGGILAQNAPCPSETRATSDPTDKARPDDPHEG